jgi:hypothetical protein
MRWRVELTPGMWSSAVDQDAQAWSARAIA